MYLLIGFLCSSSVAISYEKANSCEAISIGVGIVAAIVGCAVLVGGAYYVSSPEAQDALKESFSDYKNMTVEGTKVAYEANKKLFNDFVDYATSKGGGSASVYTADGKSYSISEMAAAGFPDFDDWDREMKQQGNSSNGGLGSIWDKLSFGLDLLDFIRVFFNDSDNIDFGPGGADQSYFQGEDGYINRETGELHFFINTLHNYRYWNTDISPRCWNLRLARDIFTYSSVVNASFRSNFRVCLYTGSAGASLPYEGETKYSSYEPYAFEGFLSNKHTGNLFTSAFVSNVDYEGVLYDFSDKTSKAINFDNLKYTCYYSEGELNCSNYLFLSTNLPVFANLMDANNYIETGDYSAAINLPPTVTPEPTKADSPPSAPTAVDVYCNHFKGNSFTPSNVVNVNYNIANEWDGTTENLTIILNGSTDVTPGITPTFSPVPTLPDQDGSNTTNNYIINITNILQPIQTTVTNIYNFFIIDTEEISLEINNINTTPVTKFGNFVTTFGNLQTTFSNDTQDVLAAAGSTQRGISYPVLKVESPKILKNYVPDDVKLTVEGKTYIVLCDCSKYAVQFSMVRTLLKVILWFGFIFYLMKELKVVISLST